MISNLREGGGDDRDDNLPGYGVQPEPGPLGVGSEPHMVEIMVRDNQQANCKK